MQRFEKFQTLNSYNRAVYSVKGVVNKHNEIVLITNTSIKKWLIAKQRKMTVKKTLRKHFET